MKVVDLTGQRFFRLTVCERVQTPSGAKGSYWLCRCDCGNTKVFSAGNLKQGHAKSCGCLTYEYQHRSHGQSTTRLYNVWSCMKKRCYNKTFEAYKDYGGRGIIVCEEWLDFANFEKWARATHYSEGLTIERIDVNGNYCPENCKWATRKQQANNRRSCLLYTYNGETHNLMEWCNLLDLDYKNIHNRLYKLKWSFEKAVETPVFVNKRNTKSKENNYGRIFNEGRVTDYRFE